MIWSSLRELHGKVVPVRMLFGCGRSLMLWLFLRECYGRPRETAMGVPARVPIYGRS